ncbi:MAG TPA: mechanosensitive ion channel domain-containing protein [Gaiellaceae bacterium]|nr:mechanosensitive ion channel domain-containing protein [Gaiellaceae bacterium]
MPQTYVRLFWGAAAILIAAALGRFLKRLAAHLDARPPDEERKLARLRRSETIIVLVATAIPYATAIVVVIILASLFLPTAATLGGSAFLGVIVGFTAQRFLMDVIAGGLIAFERWYGVGDFLMVEPSKASGLVEQFGLRTTVIRLFNGDLAYVPNSQIIAAFRSPRGYRRYSIEILTTDPEAAKHALEGVGGRAPQGEARFLRPPRVIEERELGDGVWLVRGRADVAPTMEWLAEGLLVRRLTSQLPPETLLTEPIVYTLDEATLARYARRVLVR